MKRYLLSLFALALAVGFSAFTSSKKVTTAPNTTAYYWYIVQYDDLTNFPNGYVSSANLLESTPKEASQVESPCDEGEVKDCLRAFSTATISQTDNVGFEQIKRPE